MRLESGLLRPKNGVPGYDFAGRVEAVGPGVTMFQPGDEVFGATKGTCAEYVRVAEDKLALKPANLSYEQAAALPTSALAALHGLRDAGKLQPGQKVLINGASGGVGSFAVQIAKAFGAEVTGVTSTNNVEMVRSLGADHVIDYTREDFTKGGPRYDLIFDNVENRSLRDCRRALTPSGTLVLNSGTGARGLAMLVRLLRPLVLSPFLQQNLRRYLSHPNRSRPERPEGAGGRGEAQAGHRSHLPARGYRCGASSHRGGTHSRKGRRQRVRGRRSRGSTEDGLNKAFSSRSSI